MKTQRRTTLTPSVVKELHARSIWRPAVQTSVILSSYTLLSLIGLWHESFYLWTVIWVLQGIILSGFLGAAHDCAHGTMARSPRANESLGALWATVVLFNFTLYKYFHLVHHRHTNVEGDTEPGGEFPDLSTYLKSIPTHAFYIAFWRMALRAEAGWYPDFVRTERARLAVHRDNRVKLAWLALIGTCTLLAPRYAFMIYWAPMLVYFPMVFLTSLPEHYGCDWGADEWTNTRSVESNALFRYFFWNGNYHAEHHLLPGVPSCNLGRLHAIVGDRFKFRERSYVMFHLRLMYKLTNRDSAPGVVLEPLHRIDFEYISYRAEDERSRR